jgi:carotenoid biosynthesis protein
MAVQGTAGRGSLSPKDVAVGLLRAICLVLVVGFAWNPTPLAQALAAIGILAACVHAALFYGWRDALALFAICLVITFVVENLGSLTGFPFGRYHFEVGADLPHVGVIPVIVGPLWFGMGYFSWIVAGTLLGAPARPRGKFELLAWPVVAAFQSGEVADAAGHLWRVGDLRAATVVTMLFTMFFTSVLAMLRLAAERTAC